MLKIYGHHIIYFFISISLIFGACVPYQRAVKDVLPSRSIFETGISDEEIPAEIERLKKLTEDKTGKAVSVGVYLRLAVLYSSYKNEGPDYVSALAALEKYKAVYNGGGNESEINTLHSLLLRVQHLSDNKSVKRLRSNNRALIKKSRALTKHNKDLLQQNNELIINNKALKETIEKLGAIDLKLEQKRKSYK